PNYVSINVEQQEADDHSILQFYKDLIQLKKSDDTVTYGEFNLIDSENSSIFAYTRTLSNKTAVIVGNLTNQTASLKTDLKLNKGDLKLHN
ncbi:alpha-glucosidase C-terminal domain-containing protein, partial [Staphylococcus hominis]|uniref:alpha-glucosidase C-terminal domain-containing protein n=1 Tax=Staphylococcus hominis TaxID=1290 RepID=UPI0030BA43A5